MVYKDYTNSDIMKTSLKDLRDIIGYYGNL